MEREEAPQDDATEQPHEWKWMDKILKTLDKLSESPWTPDAWVREVENKNSWPGTEDWHCYDTWWSQCVEKRINYSLFQMKRAAIGIVTEKIKRCIRTRC